MLKPLIRQTAIFLVVTLLVSCDQKTTELAPLAQNTTDLAKNTTPVATLTPLQIHIQSFDKIIQSQLIRFVGGSAERQRRIHLALSGTKELTETETEVPLNQGDYETLRQWFEQQLQQALDDSSKAGGVIAPAVIKARSLAAVCALGNPRASQAAYQLITKIAPKNPWGWLGMSEMQLVLNSKKEALDSFQRLKALVDSQPNILDDALFYAAYHTHSGLLLRNNKQWYEAEQALIKSLKQYQSLNLFAHQADVLTHIGELFIQQADWLQAQNSVSNAVQINEAINRPLDLAHNYNQMGSIYKGQEKWSSAVSLFEASLKLHQDTEFLGGQAGNYGNLGISYRNLQRFDQAEKMYKQGLALDQKLGFKEGAAIKYTNLGVLYYQKNQYDQAIPVLKSSLDLFKELGKKQQVSIVQAYLNDLDQQLNMTTGQNETQ